MLRSIISKAFFLILFVPGVGFAYNTLYNPHSGYLDFIHSSSTLPSGSTQYINNQSTIQSDAVFHISSGTITGKFYLEEDSYLVFENNSICIYVNSVQKECWQEIPAVGDRILLEIGDIVLLETGDNMLKE